MKRAARHRLVRIVAIVAVGLLLIDAFFVAAEMMNHLHNSRGGFEVFAHPGWTASPDGSFAERWGYAKAIVTGLLLLYLCLRYRRSAVLLATGVLFFVVALDDSLQFHEIGGSKLTRVLEIPNMLGVRAQDIGEILIWAAIGIPLVLWMAIAYVASNPRPRRIVRRLIPPFLGLLFFAVFIDVFTIYAAFQWDWTGRVYYLMTLIEMAGELAGLTAVLLVPLWFVLRHHIARGGHLDAATDPQMLRGNPASATTTFNAAPPADAAEPFSTDAGVDTPALDPEPVALVRTASSRES